VSNVRQALEFVCKTISDSETVREVDRHGSRAEAIASKAQEMHSWCREALDGQPRPITKKIEAILEDVKLRVYGIKRGTSKCEPVFVLTDDFDMTWNDNWNAWSCRPASGHYQQIMVFVPREDTE